jgi:hypothetical protein
LGHLSTPKWKEKDKTYKEKKKMRRKNGIIMKGKRILLPDTSPQKGISRNLF